MRSVPINSGLEIGCKVKWTSSGLSKQGTIVEIVDGAEDGYTAYVRYQQSNPRITLRDGGGHSRNKRSYLVLLYTKDKNKTGVIYWPNVGVLRVIEEFDKN